MWRRWLPLVVRERGRWHIVGRKLRHHRFVAALYEYRNVPNVRWFAGRLGALLIVLRCDIYSRHKSLSLARWRLLLLLILAMLLLLLLLLLPILRRRRHRTLTALARLRTNLHIATSLLLAYVHRVAQTVLRYRGRRCQVRLAATVRADSARATRGTATARLATRVLVHLMLLSVAATTRAAASIATIA